MSVAGIQQVIGFALQDRLALGMAGLLVADRLWHFLAAAVPLGISFSCVAPGSSAEVSLAVDKGEQGAAAGLAAAQAAGFLVGPLLFAVLYQVSGLLPFALGAADAVLLLMFVLTRPRQPR